MPGSYTIELELFSLLNGSVDGFEIYADGALLGGYSSVVSSDGSTISINVPYGGALPTSLEFRFNDTAPGSVDQIEVRSVKINDRYVNTGNYLSGTILNDGGSQTVDVTNNAFLFDASEPAASEFTTSPTQTFTSGNDQYRGFDDATPQVFDMLAGRDLAYLGAGADKVSGGDGDDTLYGFGGNDLLFGGAGNDRIYGGDDDDTLYGGDDNDRIHGNDGNDEIHGGSGDDRLNGHTGDDIITGGTGADKINGGSGNNFLFGDEGDDQIIGGANNDTIDGGADNDLLYGLGGVDQMNGGAGNDTLIGGLGDDIMHGDGGNDLMFGQADDDTMFGGAGADRIYGNTGIDTIDGGAGIDFLFGGNDADTITGGDDNDVIYGDDNDVIAGLTAYYKMDDASGQTVIDYSGNGYDGTYTGGTATWDATGGIDGGALSMPVATDDDAVEVGTWDVEGSGITLSAWVYWENITNDPRIISKTSGTSANTHDWALYIKDNASAGEDRITLRLRTVNGFSEEILEGYDFSDNLNTWTHVAVTYDEVTDGVTYYVNGVSVGSDVHNAGGAVITGSGKTVAIGNNPVAIGGRQFEGALDEVRVYDRSLTSGEMNTVYNFRDLGGTAADIINGGNGNDAIYGGGGSDTINGDDGNDTIQGNDGDDIINGGIGNDLITGGDGVDTIDGGTGNDTMYLANGDFAAGESIDGGADIDELILTNATTVDFTTGTLANLETLTGSAGNDDVTYTIQQALGFDDIDLGGGIDNSRVNTTGTINVTTLGTPVVVNTENGFLTGSAGNDILTIYGAQLDALVFGSGIINFGANNDILYLENESASLNILGATDLSIQGLETISANDSASAVTINLTGQTEDFVIIGSDDSDIITGGFGADNISAGEFDDTINLANGHFAAGESINGGASNDELILTNATTVDFTTGTLANLETLTGSSGDDDVTIDGTTLNQFTSIDFAGGTNVLNITSTSTGLNGLADGNLQNIGTISASTASAGVTIDLTSQAENFTVVGSALADTIVAGDGDHIITGGAGADNLQGSNSGSDTFLIANGDFVTGENIVGNSGTNNITLTNATTVNFSLGSIADVYDLNGSTGNDDVTFSFSQLDEFVNIDLSGGVNNMRAQLNGISIASDPGLTITNVDNGFIIGSTGNDNLTITGSYLDKLLIGAGTIDFDTGTDVLNLTSTSADLNIFGATDGSITGLEEIDASGAGAAVTINLSGQTEDFILTGGGFSDTITAGSGDDIIDGGLFGDTIEGGEGDDTIDGGNGLDNIEGGLGNDIINGGQGADILYAFDGTINTEGDSINFVNEIIFQENFSAGTGAFSYSDGGFGGSDPANVDVSGTRITTDGANTASGALEIDINSQNNNGWANASGSWDASYTAASNLANVSITFSYRHIHDDLNDTGEDSQVWFEFDGTTYNQSGASNFISEAYGAGGATDTGWVTVTIDLPDLTSGTTYNLSMGILHLGASRNDEEAAVRFDDILMTAGTEYGVADATIADADSGSNNTVNGGDNNDTIYGSAGINFLNGDNGDDTIYSGTVADEVILSDSFDINAGTYSYTEDFFTASSTSGYAVGNYVAGDGSDAAGSLSITLGGQDNDDITDMNGAWSTTFTLLEAKNDLVLNFDFRLFDSQTGSTDPFDAGEDIQLFADIDGTTYSNDANPYFFELLGVDSFDANDTGWQTISLNVGSLAAGVHTLSLGAVLSLKTFQPEEYTLRFDDVSLVDTAILNVNTLSGGDGLDTLYGSSGRDVFLFENLTAFNDVDVIENFGYTLDAIDLSDLLTSFNATTDDINDFVELTESGGNTTIAVDTAGGGSFTGNEVTVINGVTGMDVDVMQADGTLIF